MIDEYAREQIDTNWIRVVDAADNPIDAIITSFANAAEDARGPIYFLARGLADEESGEVKSARERVRDLYDLWRSCLARNLARGQRQGTVSEDVLPEDEAAFLIAFFEGSIGLAEGLQDPEVLRTCLRRVRLYLDALRPA